MERRNRNSWQLCFTVRARARCCMRGILDKQFKSFQASTVYSSSSCLNLNSLKSQQLQQQLCIFQIFSSVSVQETGDVLGFQLLAFILHVFVLDRQWNTCTRDKGGIELQASTFRRPQHSETDGRACNATNGTPFQYAARCCVPKVNRQQQRRRLARTPTDRVQRTVQTSP